MFMDQNYWLSSNEMGWKYWHELKTRKTKTFLDIGSNFNIQVIVASIFNTVIKK